MKRVLKYSVTKKFATKMAKKIKKYLKYFSKNPLSTNVENDVLGQ